MEGKTPALKLSTIFSKSQAIPQFDDTFQFQFQVKSKKSTKSKKKKRPKKLTSENVAQEQQNNDSGVDSDMDDDVSIPQGSYTSVNINSQEAAEKSAQQEEEQEEEERKSIVIPERIDGFIHVDDLHNDENSGLKKKKKSKKKKKKSKGKQEDEEEDDVDAISKVIGIYYCCYVILFSVLYNCVSCCVQLP